MRNRNLNHEEKNKIKNRYGEHMLFRLVTQSCKKYEREMRVFRLSPEDVFLESLNVLDDLKAPDRNNEDLCDTIWDDLYCEFRDRGENIPDEELNKAVAIVLSVVTYCMILLDSMRYNSINAKLIRSLFEHYRNYSEIHSSIGLHAIKIGMSDLKDWMAGYMQCDTYLCDETMGCLEERAEEEKESNEEVSNMAPNKVRAKVLLEILKQCGLGLDEQDMTKVSRLVGFIIGASANRLRNNLTSHNGLTLSEKQHGEYVKEVNNLLFEMNAKIRIKCE